VIAQKRKGIFQLTFESMRTCAMV